MARVSRSGNRLTTFLRSVAMECGKPPVGPSLRLIPGDGICYLSNGTLEIGPGDDALSECDHLHDRDRIPSFRSVSLQRAMTPSVISIFVSAVSREFGSYRREIASALRERGYHTKVQEEFNTGPGTLLEKLEAFIKRCDAVICLIGDGFGAEPRRSEAQPYSEQRRSYTQLEYLLARKHGKPVYVFFPSGPDTPRDHEQDEPEELLALQRKFWDDEIVSQGIDRTPFSDRAGLVRAVLVCDLPHAGRLVPLGPVNVACPYVGLKRFDGKDRDYFYGRTHAVDRVREHVRRAPLVLLTGNSGSGKSSLVRAGVIPAWVEEQRVRGYRSPRAVVFTPGSAPFERLWAALSGTDLDDHAVDFVKTAGAGVFRDLMERLPETDGATQPWFFFIDQFEEIFARMGDREKESRESFVAALVDLAERQEATETAAEAAGATVPEVRVVLAMRDDFFGNLRDHRKLFAITDRNLERVVAMENEELREAIEMPAARHGVRFESGLVDRLIRAVEGRAGMLPMLQFTLEALWLQEKERGGIDSGILTIESYREIGGVEGALQKRVSHYYGSKTPDERKAIRNIFLSLVEPDMGSEFLPVSRAAQKEMLVSIGGDRILRELLDKEKLLISEGRENESVVELAHEALIKGWTEFASWVTDCKEAIRIRNQLREDSRRWASAPAGLADDELWRGSRLERALELERSGEFERIGGLAARDRQFIEASEKLKHKEIRKARLLAGTASVVAIVALALAVVAFDRTNAAKEAGQTAENHLRQARLEIARAWLERARRFHNQKDFFGSALMAAKGLGFAGFGRELGEDGFKREHEVFLDPGLLDHDETAGELGSLVRESSLQIPFWKSGGWPAPRRRVRNRRDPPVRGERETPPPRQSLRQRSRGHRVAIRRQGIRGRLCRQRGSQDLRHRRRLSGTTQHGNHGHLGSRLDDSLADHRRQGRSGENLDRRARLRDRARIRPARHLRHRARGRR